MKKSFTALLAIAALISVPGADANAIGAATATDRLIIKLSEDGDADSGARKAKPLNERLPIVLTRARRMANGAYVFKLPRAYGLSELVAFLQQIRQDPDVIYAEPDLLVQPLLIPNDALYARQWTFQDSAGGVNLPAAWEITTGASDLVVAVLDTGVLPHEDLGRILPGYDFVSPDTSGTYLRANDGDGRDSDPTDPGDWVLPSESASGLFAGCSIRSSSWHGTHVTGTLSALSDNGTGVAGINWASGIVPARVLGKCGGYSSDIIDAMYWVAGLPVAGIAPNPHPAKVLNMSLGAAWPNCPLAYQEAVKAVNATGAVVVAAAGNNNEDVAGVTPANCAGVIAVAATDRAGEKAWYSNHGSGITVAAPGGVENFVNDPDAVWSTLNDGLRGAGDDSYRAFQGTSMAVPHVAGIISLMLSANPHLMPTNVVAIIRATARQFPPGSNCARVQCGAGIVDASGAVQAATTAILAQAPAGNETGINVEENGPVVAAVQQSSGGGCALGPTRAFDPLLPLLVLAAAAALFLRQRR